MGLLLLDKIKSSLVEIVTKKLSKGEELNPVERMLMEFLGISEADLDIKRDYWDKYKEAIVLLNKLSKNGDALLVSKSIWTSVKKNYPCQWGDLGFFVVVSHEEFIREVVIKGGMKIDGILCSASDAKYGRLKVCVDYITFGFIKECGVEIEEDSFKRFTN